jgi:hypothetical protein
LGPAEQDVKRTKGVAALVADSLRRGGAEAETVRRAVSQLLEWHEQHGPITHGKHFFARAAAAYAGLTPLS